MTTSGTIDHIVNARLSTKGEGGVANCKGRGKVTGWLAEHVYQARTEGVAACEEREENFDYENFDFDSKNATGNLQRFESCGVTYRWEYS